jgi:hypothetical protein
VPYELERRGFRSEVAENIRRQYQERAETREAQQKDRSPADAWLKYREAHALQKSSYDAVQAWRKYREQNSNRDQGKEPQNGRDDDFSL